MHLKKSAPEVKVLLKWWRVIRSKFMRGTSSEAISPEDKRLKASKIVQRI